ncbi:hypothetical protein [Massilia violaceinigra]|uniref:hypothetical protein n=1 Tax=Massilia violaceinigra TaxID=2045208 RepID=UPI001FB3E7A8|nr:hypothetical protein [Massilia violaceinigra]
MTKTASAKTNGHTIPDLKEVAPAARATRAAPKKAGATPAATKAVTAKPAKASTRAPVKAAAKTPVAKAAPVKAAAKPAAAKPIAAKAAPVKPATAKEATVKVANKPAAVKPDAAKAAPKRSAATPAKASPKQAPKPPATAAEGDVGARDKARKAKLVRDSFTMPEQEYAVLGQVKKACLKAGFEIKKSELLRIGVALISDLDIATLQKVLSSLPQLKTGRPKSE